MNKKERMEKENKCSLKTKILNSEPNPNNRAKNRAKKRAIKSPKSNNIFFVRDEFGICLIFYHYDEFEKISNSFFIDVNFGIFL